MFTCVQKKQKVFTASLPSRRRAEKDTNVYLLAVGVDDGIVHEVLQLPHPNTMFAFVKLMLIDKLVHKLIVEISNRSIKLEGIIWVSWPKKSSKGTTALDENIVHHTALSIGMVDVKGCTVTEVWSGLNQVIR